MDVRFSLVAFKRRFPKDFCWGKGGTLQAGRKKETRLRAVMGEGTGPIWNLGTGPRRVGWGLTALARGGGGGFLLLIAGCVTLGKREPRGWGVLGFQFLF